MTWSAGVRSTQARPAPFTLGIVLGPADSEFSDPKSRSFMMLVPAQSGAKLRLLLTEDNVVQRCNPSR